MSGYPTFPSKQAATDAGYVLQPRNGNIEIAPRVYLCIREGWVSDLREIGIPEERVKLTMIWLSEAKNNAGHTGASIEAITREQYDELVARYGAGPDLRRLFVHLRHELGMTQTQAGEALDRSASWVRAIEQGQIECPRYAVLAMRCLLDHMDAPA